MAPPVIVYYWPGSPWSSKAVAYLSLRKIPFAECHQPITMPRPVLTSLGVNYRRVPLISVGKDIYCDSLLILQKLEALFPPSNDYVTISAQTVEQKVLEKLLEKWTDAVVFGKAADCIPLDHPLVVDPAFIKDRTELWGETWERSEREKKRPEGLVHMREFFNFLENTLLSDGRPWALGKEGPTLSDIHSAWIFNWMLSLESFPESMVSPKIYPKVFAWCERYQKAVTEAQDAAKPEVIEGDEVLKRVGAASFAEDTHGVDPVDPLDLKEGQQVTLAPTDTGFTAPEKGPLVAVTHEEIVVGSKTKDGTEVHIHAPRWNFRVRPAVVGLTNGS